MAIPANAGRILQFLGFAVDIDFRVHRGPPGNSYALEWLVAAPQPTDQAINDAGADLTTINGQVFSEWFAENKGNPTLTRARRAKDRFEGSEIESLVDRAAAEHWKGERNQIIRLFQEVQDQFTAIKNTTGGAQAIRDAINDPSPVTHENPLDGTFKPARIKNLRATINEIQAIIDAGTVDDPPAA